MVAIKTNENAWGSKSKLQTQISTKAEENARKQQIQQEVDMSRKQKTELEIQLENSWVTVQHINQQTNKEKKLDAVTVGENSWTVIKSKLNTQVNTEVEESTRKQQTQQEEDMALDLSKKPANKPMNEWLNEQMIHQDYDLAQMNLNEINSRIERVEERNAKLKALGGADNTDKIIGVPASLRDAQHEAAKILEIERAKKEATRIAKQQQKEAAMAVKEQQLQSDFEEHYSTNLKPLYGFENKYVDEGIFN